MEQFLNDNIDIIRRCVGILAGIGLLQVISMIYKTLVYCFIELWRKLKHSSEKTLENDYGKLFINGGIGETDKDKIDELTTYYMEDSNHFIRLNSQGKIVGSGWKVTLKAQND